MNPKDTTSINKNSDINFQDGMNAYDEGDYKTALNKWKPLAKQGYAKAQYSLGLMYANGTAGALKDDKHAIKWYRKAASQGHTGAQAKLSFMFFNGIHTPRDDKHAVELYRKAANQGPNYFNHLLFNDLSTPKDDSRSLNNTVSDIFNQLKSFISHIRVNIINKIITKVDSKIKERELLSFKAELAREHKDIGEYTDKEVNLILSDKREKIIAKIKDKSLIGLLITLLIGI